MESKIVTVSLDKFLQYRSDKNSEFFTQAIDSNHIELLMVVGHGITMRAVMNKNDEGALSIIEKSNTFVPMESLMLQTHNFGDSTSWADGTSMFCLAPLPGYKLIITSIVARFPENVDLDANPISFTVYKYVPPYGVVPVVQDVYTSIKSLLVTSNSPWYTVEFNNANAFTQKMIEVKFRYADSDENDWSKLTLFSSRGEHIDVQLGQVNTPLLAVGGGALADPCYSIFNTKRVLDF